MLAGKLVRLAAIAAVSAMALTVAPAAVSAKGYAELDKLPDWSGVWQPDWGSLFAGRGGSGPPAGPKLTPAAAKVLADFNAAKAEGKNLQTAMANCTPPLPRRRNASLIPGNRENLPRCSAMRRRILITTRGNFQRGKPNSRSKARP